MRIERLRSEREGDKARVAASVVWEDCERAPQDIYFATQAEFEADLTCTPHAFLVACLAPAMRHGEERIAIDEEICPQLRNGLVTAMAWLADWYGPHRKPVRIEAKAGARLPRSRTAERVGSFLSGGIDSLATLRWNRLDYPLTHPNAIKDCLFVHGFDIGGIAGNDAKQATFEAALAALTDIIAEAQVTILPVFTNIRHLDDDVHFWIYEFHGAALAAVAHAFATRLSKVHIASTFDYRNLKPWGSHPLLDPNYSSAEVDIVHDGVQYSRLDKVRVVAGWDAALQNLRVCTMNEPGMLNCGRCEKCIRTMVELLAIGKLAQTHAFQTTEVSGDLLRSITIDTEYQDACYREAIEPLRAVGQQDLAAIIEEKSAHYHRHQVWLEERDWKGAVKRFDRKYLASGLFRSYKTFREWLRPT